MRTAVTVIRCDICGTEPASEDHVRDVFGVDVCDGCFAARAGESLDAVAKASKAATARRAQDAGASAQYAGLAQNNSQARYRG